MNAEEIQIKLTELALERTTPFCYSCYQDCPNGHCNICGSDDLMRHLKGIGVEYGTDWIIEHILEEELHPVDINELFEEHVRACYPEMTQVGWMTFDTIELIKCHDLISWEIAHNEYVNDLKSNESNDYFFTDSASYLIYDVEKYLRRNEII